MKPEAPSRPWNTGGASGCRIYKVYFSESDLKNEGRDALVIDSDAEAEKRRAGILDGMKFVRYIIAHDWAEAMTKHHQKMGWGPYVPFELENDP